MKVNKTFIYALSIVSIIGFLSIFLDSFFGIKYVSDNQSALILMVLGGGLLIEAEIRKMIKGIKLKTASGIEITHILTGIVGLIALISGFLELVSIATPQIQATKGIISLLAMVFIALETWVV